MPPKSSSSRPSNVKGLYVNPPMQLDVGSVAVI